MEVSIIRLKQQKCTLTAVPPRVPIVLAHSKTVPPKQSPYPSQVFPSA